MSSWTLSSSSPAEEAPERSFLSVTDSTTSVKPLFGYLSSFTSLGTLACCALPSLLVLFGIGATVAAVVSSAPWLMLMSRHKGYVFATSGALVAEASACRRAERLGRAALGVASALWFAGFSSPMFSGPFL